MRLCLIFLSGLTSYVMLYVTYAASATTLAGRVVWTIAVVLGTLLGSTLGERWFR
jgi:hypothetical protein